MCPFQFGAANTGGIAKVKMWVRDWTPPNWVPLVGDDLAAVRLLQCVVVGGGLYLPRPALSLSTHDSIVLRDSSSEGGAARSGKRERFALCDEQSVLGGNAVVAAPCDLGVRNARQRKLDRLEEVLNRLLWRAASHAATRRMLAGERQKHGDS